MRTFLFIAWMLLSVCRLGAQEYETLSFESNYTETLDFPNRIGEGDINPQRKIEIVGEGIDDTGITSAYQPHRFYLKANGYNFTNEHWELRLPLTDGGYEVVAKSSSSRLQTPAITDDSKYKRTIDGDIAGTVVFNGATANEDLSGEYKVTFELKPHIWDAKILKISPSSYIKGYYDITVSAKYDGDFCIRAFVLEYETGTQQRFSSSKPYYTEMKLTDVDMSGKVSVRLVVENQYGDQTVYLHPSLPSNPKFDNLERDPSLFPEFPMQNEIDKAFTTGSTKFSLSYKKIYNKQGKLIKTIKYISK